VEENIAEPGPFQTDIKQVHKREDKEPKDFEKKQVGYLMQTSYQDHSLQRAHVSALRKDHTRRRRHAFPSMHNVRSKRRT
jgi:hypothetical protein